MRFRFYKRIKIAPGVTLNWGKRGTSVSFGPRGARTTIGPHGVRSSVGIPGTGIRYEKKYSGGSTMCNGFGGGKNVLISILLCLLFGIGALIAFPFYKDQHSQIALVFMVACIIGIVMTLLLSFCSWYFLADDKAAASKMAACKLDASKRYVSKSPSTPIKTGERWDTYVKELALASQALYNFLKEMNRSTRCRNQVNALSGLEALDVGENIFTINRRLAAIVYCDIRDCFRRLGHSTTDLYNLEGVGFAMIACLLISKNFNLTRFYNRDLAMRLSRRIADFDLNAKLNIDIERHPDDFRFAVIFGKVNSERERVQRFSTLLYRWASLVAKADGTVTAKESETLAFIMKLNDVSDGSNVRVIGSREDPSSKPRYEIPSFDDESQSGNPAKGADSTEDLGRNNGRKALESVLQSLDELVGLEPVKKTVRDLTDFIRVQLKRKQVGLKVSPISYHCVFTGNPGTGKTTVARILADIYREMGVVKKGQLVETDRSGLVAEYIGQTAVKTNKIIDQALDGILFIDEAYSLVQGGDKDFGREAISTLLKRMEDDRDRLVVVLAGYTEEMKDFIDSNPGLQSRFNRYIGFPDYTAEELASMFLRLTEKNQYTCNQDVRNSIVQIIEHAVAGKDRNFGNGRYVRNLFEKTIQRQAVRLSGVAPLTAEMLSELTLDDLGIKGSATVLTESKEGTRR